MKHLQCKNATNNDVRENWGNFNPYKQQMINGTQAVVLAYLKMLMDNVNTPTIKHDAANQTD